MRQVASAPPAVRALKNPTILGVKVGGIAHYRPNLWLCLRARLRSPAKPRSVSRSSRKLTRLLLLDVGLDYLTLTLRRYASGGEAQRIRNSDWFGSGLGVLRSTPIGLHQRDKSSPH